MSKAKDARFAPPARDVTIMIRYRDRIWQTDYCGTQMCKSEVSRLDKAEIRGCYCNNCRKIECVRNRWGESTTSLWRKIQTISPRIGGAYVTSG